MHKKLLLIIFSALISQYSILAMQKDQSALIPIAPINPAHQSALNEALVNAIKTNQKKDVIINILNKGAQINTKEDPLFEATILGNLPVVALLFKRGAIVTADEWCTSSISFAACRGYYGIVKLYLEYGTALLKSDLMDIRNRVKGPMRDLLNARISKLKHQQTTPMAGQAQPSPVAPQPVMSPAPLSVAQTQTRVEEQDEDTSIEQNLPPKKARTDR